MEYRELRLKTAEFRAKKTDNGRMLVSGYVNLTGQFSDPLTITSDEKFVETIAPGAFKRSLSRSKELGRDIDFLAEHDTTKILSSTRNNSLTLREDNKGLYMSAIITPTTWGEDYYSLVSEGIIRNFSFGFTVKEENDEWRFNENGMHERVIRDLDLFEVSIVRHPAYPQSYVEARDIMSSDKIIEIRKGDSKMEDKTKLEIREEESDIDKEEDREEPEIVDVTGSIISTDQRLNVIEKKLDEVLTFILTEDEEEEIQEEEEVKQEKQEEIESKKEEMMEDEIDEERSEDKSIELRNAIDELIKEFEGEEE